MAATSVTTSPTASGTTRRGRRRAGRFRRVPMPRSWRVEPRPVHPEVTGPAAGPLPADLVQLDGDLVVLDLPAGELAFEGLGDPDDHLGVGGTDGHATGPVGDEALPEHADLESALEFGIVGVEAKVRCHSEIIVIGEATL